MPFSFVISNDGWRGAHFSRKKSHDATQALSRLNRQNKLLTEATNRSAVKIEQADYVRVRRACIPRACLLSGIPAARL